MNIQKNNYFGTWKDMEWKLTFSWLPRKCIISNKLIWLKYGYRCVRFITGPSEPIYFIRWHDKNEHIIWMLKNV